MSGIKEVLKSLKVDDLPKPVHNKAITIDSKLTPEQGFKVLVENNILAAPVYNAETKEYTGFLDIRDFVSFVVHVCGDATSKTITFEELVKEGLKKFAVKTEGITVSYLSRRHRFIPKTKDTTLYEIAEELSKGNHRVPIVAEDGSIVRIVSQSNILQVIAKHFQSFSEGSKSLKDLGLSRKEVLHVNQGQSAYQTFKLMDDNNRSGVAVVDGQGNFLSCTTGKDLKPFLNNPVAYAVHLPIMEFLKAVRMQSVDIKAPTIAVSESKPLVEVVGKLVATKVHRIFVVESSENYKPIGVISITDILKLILN